jgi:hypothetical protein
MQSLQWPHLNLEVHILCDCEAVVHIRFRHLGQFFVKPNDYYDAPIDEALTLFEV